MSWKILRNEKSSLRWEIRTLLLFTQSIFKREREREVFDLDFLFIGSISLTNRRAQHFPFHIVHHLYTIQFSQSSSLLLALRWLIERGVLVFSLLLNTNWSGTVPFKRRITPCLEGNKINSYCLNPSLLTLKTFYGTELNFFSNTCIFLYF